MLIHDVIQGSEAWHLLRAGKPTASAFDKAIKRLKLSEAAKKRGETQGESSRERENYKYKIVAERLLGRPVPTETGGFYWMNHGMCHEAQAADLFSKTYGLELEKIGFIEEDGLGCSPDRIVTGYIYGNVTNILNSNIPRIAIEIKCPAPWTVVDYLLNGLGEEYYVQMQGQCLVGHFDMIHFFAWYPGLPPFHKMVERDNGYCAWLKARLGEFQLEVDHAVAKIEKMQKVST